MANWYGTARSNYFLVKNPEVFTTWAAALNLEVFEQGHLFGIGSYEGWPSSIYDEEADEDTEIYLPQELSAHLQEGQVAVLMEAGAEKLRYVTGSAIAVSWTGKIVTIYLEDIYKKASEAFGVPNISVAEY